jgi:hypothetical protein
LVSKNLSDKHFGSHYNSHHCGINMARKLFILPLVECPCGKQFRFSDNLAMDYVEKINSNQQINYVNGTIIQYKHSNISSLDSFLINTAFVSQNAGQENFKVSEN